MLLTPSAEATLLLTTTLKHSDNAAVSPLTPVEWGDFSTWIEDQHRVPGDLLNCNLADSLQTWEHSKVTISRIQSLLNRGAALGFSIERWTRAGLWVITQEDENYPVLLKQRLGNRAPAVLFGCGDVSLLSKNGIAVVGARHADDSDLFFARRIGGRIAEIGESVISGGSAGIDQAAMFGALAVAGTALGILGESLLRATTSSQYREHILTGNLVLISTFNPESSFSIPKAMARNKYIYCLSHDAIVVSSTPEKGGTWQGATENLRRGWVPLKVKPTDSEKSGNAKLVSRGGAWFNDLNDPMFERTSQNELQTTQSPRWIDLTIETSNQLTKGNINDATQAPNQKVDRKDDKSSRINTQESTKSDEFPNDDPAEALFQTIRMQITKFCRIPRTREEIAEVLKITKATLDPWLKRLVENHDLKKEQRPARYVVRERDLLE